MSRPFHTIPTTECYTVDLYILGIKEDGITTKLQPPHKFMIKTQFTVVIVKSPFLFVEFLFLLII